MWVENLKEAQRISEEPWKAKNTKMMKNQKTSVLLRKELESLPIGDETHLCENLKTPINL
jgi:hypothetical protein